MTARIEVSPLTGRIYRGRVNAAGTAFVGEKQDVTSDVLRAVLSKANYHGGTFEISNGTKTWTVTVSEEPNAELSGPRPLAAEGVTRRAADLCSAARDCRTCAHHTYASGGCVSALRCVGGDRYKPTQPRQLWEERPVQPAPRDCSRSRGSRAA